MNEEQIKALFTALGAFAEASTIFYKASRRSGANQEEALMLTQMMMQMIFQGTLGNSKED